MKRSARELDEQEKAGGISPMPCLDGDVLAELREILGDDLNAVAVEFVAQFNDLLIPLRAAQQAANWPEVRRIAHLLKGSAGNLGIHPLAARLLALEQAARAGDADTVARELEDATALGADCIEELARQGLLAG
jgi:HPt (histidine-containing phosphotransfer) domain-containing protein